MPITKPEFRKKPPKERRTILRKQRNLSVTAKRMGKVLFSALHTAVEQKRAISDTDVVKLARQMKLFREWGDRVIRGDPEIFLEDFSTRVGAKGNMDAYETRLHGLNKQTSNIILMAKIAVERGVLTKAQAKKILPTVEFK